MTTIAAALNESSSPSFADVLTLNQFSN